MLKYTEEKLTNMHPKDFRMLVKKSEWKSNTVGICQGYAQASLAIVPKQYAFDFLLFCTRNYRSCPILEVHNVGDYYSKKMAPGADLRTDFPRYRVFEDGRIIDEPTDILNYWRNDFVSFLLGCGLTLIPILKSANLSWRRYGGCVSTIPCIPVGIFHGNTVVGVRTFFNSTDAIKAIQITSRYPLFHGAPIYLGDPENIGIKNLGKTGSRNEIEKSPVITDSPKPGEIILYWAGAVTPQQIAIESKVPFMITHYPGHELVTDKLANEFAIF